MLMQLIGLLAHYTCNHLTLYKQNLAMILDEKLVWKISRPITYKFNKIKNNSRNK